MSIKHGVFFTALLFALVSCTRNAKFPPLHSEKMDVEHVILTDSLFFSGNEIVPDSIGQNEFSDELEQMQSFKKWYEDKNEKFDLTEFENLWNNFKTENDSRKLSAENLKTWIETTGFLLELSGKGKYAEELEWISYFKWQIPESQKKRIYELLESYVFTKDVDHIFVNQFMNSSIDYEHSFFGKVTITQENHFQKSGNVILNFSLEERKYIELNIRIPEWAEGSTVTVKKVKYVALPGTYCKIAKKWKEGDVVEIEFPANKMPDYLKF